MDVNMSFVTGLEGTMSLSGHHITQSTFTLVGHSQVAGLFILCVVDYE